MARATGGGAERAVWSETDGPEAERLLGELDDLLEAETFNDDFVQGLVQSHIARICNELGVTPPGGAEDSGTSFSGSPPPRGEGPGVGAQAPGLHEIAAERTGEAPSGEPAEGLVGEPPLRRSSA